jgi:acetyl/propionyl-CoA carboxylase alpha subunit
VDCPRHIEVQVFGDGRGEGVHLFERDCSLQRRHQKVWEEAPASSSNSVEWNVVREKLVDSALKLVRAAAYRNAGTVEFLVDPLGQFYFLEMNTRLQVEHPVTELVTGVDLVWAQIAQALAPEQKVLSEVPTLRGHAIEVRLYAEDPAQGFIPTPGKVEKLRWPTGAGIRIESGIEEGQTIGTQFDSMLGKLIVWAENRQRALSRLQYALEETVILGVGSNQNYLRTLAHHPWVQEGRTHTGFLQSEFGNFSSIPSESDLHLLSAALAAGLTQGGLDRAGVKQHPSPWFSGPRFASHFGGASSHLSSGGG